MPDQPLTRPLAALFLGLLLPGFAAAQVAGPGAARCEVAARTFLDGLVPGQRKRAVVAFDDAARRNPPYPPGREPPRTGVRTGELADGQRIRLHDFLSCALSSQGYQKALAIIRRSDLVSATYSKLQPPDREARADVGNGYYWITVFGEPSPDKPWGWRLEGHHLGLNVTVADGRMSVTPMVMSADPAVMTRGPWAGFRVMDAEFTRGLELLESLTPEQRARAVLSPALPQDMFTTPGSAGPAPKAQGLPGAQLNEAQRRLLWRLIGEYVGNAEGATADRLLGRIRTDGIEQVWFAWMGPTERGKPVYYRVQGPSIVIEFLQADKAVATTVGPTTKEPDINHIHTWWQAPGDDYGADLLKAGAGNAGAGT